MANKKNKENKKIEKKGLWIVWAWIIMMSVAVVAENKNDKAFEEGLAAAAKYKQQSIDIFKSFKPEATFDDFNKSPKQSQYYHGVDQTETTIKEDAVIESKNSDVLVAVIQADENLKSIDKEALGNDIKRISEIQDHANNIVRGISDEFIDCTNQESCTTTYEEKQCEETPDTVQKYCKKTLTIELVPHPVDTHYVSQLTLASSHHEAAVEMDALTSQIRKISKNTTASLRPIGQSLPNDIDCQSLKVTQKKIHNAHHTEVKANGFGLYCDGGHPVIHLAVEGDKKSRSEIIIQIDMLSSKVEFEIKDRWNDGCLGLDNHASCTFLNEQCAITQSTRIIQGIPVTRDCWEKESAYRCSGGAGMMGGTCQPMRDQGCEQMKSVCIDRSDGGCNKYLQTFRCATKNCSITGAICNGTTYCLDGDCVDSQKKSDPDFQRAIAALSAVSSAGSQLENETFVFKGHPAKCDNLILGAANCCREDGWLIDDISLIKCSDEEKKLGHDKENGLTHYVGHYSDDCALGVCLKEWKAYCVFPDKLARIVQEQGREKQLGIHFGSAKHPNCDGITIEDLQKIDFNQIDFREFYEDIAKKQSIEDESAMNQRIQDKLNKIISEGKSYVGLH